MESSFSFLKVGALFGETWLTTERYWDTGRIKFRGRKHRKCFLYCGFGFVYKSIRIPRRTVAGDVLRERDNR